MTGRRKKNQIFGKYGIVKIMYLDIVPLLKSVMIGVYVDC